MLKLCKTLLIMAVSISSIYTMECNKLQYGNQLYTQNNYTCNVQNQLYYSFYNELVKHMLSSKKQDANIYEIAEFVNNRKKNNGSEQYKYSTIDSINTEPSNNKLTLDKLQNTLIFDYSDFSYEQKINITSTCLKYLSQYISYKYCGDIQPKKSFMQWQSENNRQITGYKINTRNEEKDKAIFNTITNIICTFNDNKQFNKLSDIVFGNNNTHYIILNDGHFVHYSTFYRNYNNQSKRQMGYALNRRNNKVLINKYDDVSSEEESEEESELQFRKDNRERSRDKEYNGHNSTSKENNRDSIHNMKIRAIDDKKLLEDKQNKIKEEIKLLLQNEYDTYTEAEYQGVVYKVLNDESKQYKLLPYNDRIAIIIDDITQDKTKLLDEKDDKQKRIIKNRIMEKSYTLASCIAYLIVYITREHGYKYNTGINYLQNVLNAILGKYKNNRDVPINYNELEWHQDPKCGQERIKQTKECINAMLSDKTLVDLLIHFSNMRTQTNTFQEKLGIDRKDLSISKFVGYDLMDI